MPTPAPSPRTQPPRRTPPAARSAATRRPGRRRSGASRLSALPLLDLAPHQLAGGGARQLVHELDVARDLVAGKVGLDVLARRVGGEVGAPRRTTYAARRWPMFSSSTQ